MAVEPIFTFDSTKITLYLTDDSLKNPMKFAFVKDTIEYRKYNILYKWIPGTMIPKLIRRQV